MIIMIITWIKFKNSLKIKQINKEKEEKDKKT